MRIFFIVTALFLANLNFGQEKKIVEILQAGSFDRNEKINPGANILKKNENIRVHLFHDGMNIFSDYALFFKKTNSFQASGNVVVKQGDSITLISNNLDYNGNTKKIIARGKVDFTNNQTNLKTNLLFHDRVKREFYFEEGGVIKDSTTTIISDSGKFIENKSKYQFTNDVYIENPNYKINSNKLDYFTKSNHSYFYGPTNIMGSDYKIYCEKGFYDTNNKEGYFTQNSKINYDKRIIEGDSLTFNDAIQFASATKNIIITDTINNSIIKGNYAEVFKSIDSAMITKKPYAIKVFDNDSLFIKADTLFAIGPDFNRIIKGRFNVKFFRQNLTGKSDKIIINDKSGITKLLRNEIDKKELQVLTNEEITKKNPVIWIGKSQMSGDEIHIIRELKTNLLDSLKILNNAFIIEKDSIGIENFNQMKGINLYGKFVDNELQKIDLKQNTEMIYHLYDEKSMELIGVDRAICSSISMKIEGNKIKEITFFTDPQGNVYPENQMEPNLKILNGFNWRIKEKVNNKEDFLK